MAINYGKGKNTSNYNLWKGDLQTHIKFLHEGQKIPYPKCQYKTTRKGNLQKHTKSVHES